jgi:YD repeat-containing protein
VIKKLALICVVVFLWQCITAPTSRAQNANLCLATTTWWFSDPIPPGWFVYSGYPGTFVLVIAAHKCPPKPESLCNMKAPTPIASQPVCLWNGNTFIKQTDVSLPGLGGGLTLRRTWNSLWPQNELASSIGLFGPNWKSTYEERVFMGGDNYLRYAGGDGSYWAFGISDSGGWGVVSPGNVSATISQTASNWLLSFQSGEQRQFSLTTGLLTAIVDRNGNTTQLTYDSSNRLTTVTDPASRHLYFNYANGSSYLVTSVTSDFGLTLSYAYDTNNRLTQVTQPDLTTITYTYNSQSQITQVTDSNGKVLESHTYDLSGHGLTSSQANGVNSVTLTVPQ